METIPTQVPASAPACAGISLAAQDDRLAVKPRTACAMLGVGLTRLYELLNSGQLVSYRDGRSRKILTQSIREYIARRLAETSQTKAA